MTEPKLAPKPAPGPLAARFALAQDPRLERARICRESAERFVGRPFGYQGIQIVLESVSVTSNRGVPGVVCRVRAEIGGEPVAMDPLVGLFPPPVMVHDGTFRSATIRDKDVLVPNCREDAEAALKEAVGQVVAKKVGKR